MENKQIKTHIIQHRDTYKSLQEILNAAIALNESINFVNELSNTNSDNVDLQAIETKTVTEISTSRRGSSFLVVG